MVKFSPSMFITPSIVFVVILALYFFFKKKVKEKHAYSHVLYATLIVAYVLNFVWELAHGPLYKGFQYDEKHILLLVGGLGANFSEMIHLENGHWTYNSTMPLLPLTGAGVTPVLQFTFLPWFIFLIISKIIKRKVS